jgi:outer membrane lipoprotein-sorting protein
MRFRTMAMAALLALGGWLPGVAASAQPAPAAPQWGLPALMKAMAEVRAQTADFVERKYMSVLTQPLESSGTLVYLAPAKLQKDTLQPKPQRLVVEGDTLTIEDGSQDRSRTLSLADYPQIGAIVESIRATLAGDQKTLEQFYTVALSGSASRWQILLTPRDRKVQEMVTSIRISGHDAQVDEVDTQEANGDRTDMTIVKAGK